MTLENVLCGVNNNIRIRVFTGCQTIYNGRKSSILRDMKARYYLSCAVVNVNHHKDHITVLI